MKWLKGLYKNEIARIIAGASVFLPALIIDHAFDLFVLSLVLYITALVITGIPVFVDAVRGILRRDFLDEKFLMSIASIGAMIVGEYAEGVAVMLFFLVGEYFEHRATRRARNSIKSLVEICPDTARVIEDGSETEVDAEDVEAGSLISIRPGERVPIDSVIISGSAEVDTSALTGESVPRPVTVGDSIDSGVILMGGAVIARTERLAEESRASRVLALVEEASDRKSKEESFITVFSKYYTPIVIGLAVLVAVVPIIFGLLDWRDSVHRALSFLVVSCPCALVISVPMAFFGGIGAAASRGVLYKGGNVFSAVARADRVIFDKTGTLTNGEFGVTEVVSTDIPKDRFIRLVASAEQSSNHPIARGLAKASDNKLDVTDVEEIAGHGVIATVVGQRVAVGNRALMTRIGAAAPYTFGESLVYVAIDGEYKGYIRLSDTVKNEAYDAISDLRRLGVKRTYILSGDRRESVERVGVELGIDEACAELLPEEKYKALENIIEGGKSTIYVGDGINDTPCIARADVGIAMGERGSDSAIEAADVVIMSDKLDRIPEAIKTARRTVRIAKQNIVFAISIKVLVMALVSLNLANMWVAVFADVGVAILAILNSMRTMIGKK